MSLYQVEWLLYTYLWSLQFLLRYITVIKSKSMSLHQVEWVLYTYLWSLQFLLRYITVIKSKSMSLYHLEWVFRYLPVVLIVFTKVNHNHKVQKYVIIPRGVGIKIPSLGPYSFYKGKSQS